MQLGAVEFVSETDQDRLRIETREATQRLRNENAIVRIELHRMSQLKTEVQAFSRFYLSGGQAVELDLELRHPRNTALEFLPLD